MKPTRKRFGRGISYYAQCGACKRRYTKRLWRRLEFVGVWHFPADDEFIEQNLELRNCPCRSTIGVDRGPGFAKESFRVSRDPRRRRFPRVILMTRATAQRMRRFRGAWFEGA